MTGLLDVTKNAMLDALTGLAVYASLHTVDPATTGASEVTGGAPAYARQPISWAAGSVASKKSSGPVVFNVPGGSTTIAHLGYWSAATAGTFYGSRPLDAAQTFPTQGTYTIPTGSITENLT
jgi:hypothetical protein